ncbi:MAG: aldehyde dehydrogenase [Coriobacteriales bacterium]
MSNGTVGNFVKEEILNKAPNKDAVPEVKCEYGVFETIPECIDAAEKAQQELVEKFTLKDRKVFEEAVRKAFIDEHVNLAQLEYDETGYGRVADKIPQINGTAHSAPGVDYLPSGMFCNDDGLTIEYYAPFGIIGALTPVTNPACTILGNGLANMAAGNAMVFNAHPSGKVSTAVALQLFNKAVVEAGGPNNILTMVKIPTMDTLKEITDSPKVSLMIGTGGPGMVATLMKSGKKAIVAGPGNPPSIVDEGVDIAKAAAGILAIASFNNNILCIAEKEIFVLESVADQLVEEFKKLGCQQLTDEEAAKVKDLILLETPGSVSGYSPNKKYVGKDAAIILQDAGVEVTCDDPRLAIWVTDNDDPLVQTEQMMPIMPIVKCKTFEEALERAYNAEHQNKHSSGIWTNNAYHATAMAKKMNTTVFVQNGPMNAAFGNGGAGTDAPTIATPTGEGPTGPWTFVRKRRMALADGLYYAL